MIGSGGAGDTVMIQAYVFLKLCSSGEKWTINFKTRNTSEEGDRLIVEVLSDKMTSVLERSLKRSGVGGQTQKQEAVPLKGCSWPRLPVFRSNQAACVSEGPPQKGSWTDSRAALTRQPSCPSPAPRVSPRRGSGEGPGPPFSPLPLRRAQLRELSLPGFWSVGRWAHGCSLLSGDTF